MSSQIDRLSEDAREQAEKKSMPDWVDPMLAKLTHEYFSGEDWIFGVIRISTPSTSKRRIFVLEWLFN